MNNMFFNIIFLVFTLYILIKVTSFGLYEINKENNKSGGIAVIIFTFASVIFSNSIIWIMLLKS